MPRGNGTGPNGAGPMTGRAAGYCAGNGMPGCADPAAGRGMGRGAGRGFGGGFGASAGRGAGRGAGFGRGAGLGRGDGRGFGAPAVGAQPIREEAALERRLEALEAELNTIRLRLTEIKTAPAPEGDAE